MNQVIHLENVQTFQMDTDNSQDNSLADLATADVSKDTAHLTYERMGNNINFTHTFVPFRQRGKGHAEALVKAGLEWASDHNFTISTSCWYVEKYMAEHPE